MSTNKPAVGDKFPTITLPLIGGGTRDLGTAREGYEWQMTVVYRGKHCPVCTKYLKELNDVFSELQELGVDLLCVSADSEVSAKSHLLEINPDFPVAYGLSMEQMQSLGLYVTGPQKSNKVDGPFSEPGLFVINQSGTLQIAMLSNVPFGRPNIPSLMIGLRYIRKQDPNFPITGTHT